MRPDPIVVVGAGITGLATAYALVEGGADVVVLEASPRSGGNVRTTRIGACVLDEGPDAWVASKPSASRLARRLGLGEQLIETIPEHRATFVAGERGLVKLPDGMMLGVPTRLWPMVRTPLLSLRGKLRAAVDLAAPAGFGRGDDDDESIGAFIARRLGKEVRDRIAEPLLGAIFHGDVDRLSLRATFPHLAALEARGGIIRGSRVMASRATGSPFSALRGGIDQLTSALARSLGDRVRHRSPVLGIERVRHGFALRTERDSIRARGVVVTTPAHAAATMLAGLADALAHELASIRHASSSTVFVAFEGRAAEGALPGSGYLVPAALGRPATAVTCVTNKWSDRAPAGATLFRVFFPTDDLDDRTLVELARGELRASLGLAATPAFTHVARFSRATPLPEVGHLARVARIRAAADAIPGLHLAGNGLDGFGLSDCVRQGEALASALLAQQAA